MCITVITKGCRSVYRLSYLKGASTRKSVPLRVCTRISDVKHTLKYVKNHTKGYTGKASNHIAQAKKLSNLKISTAFAKCRRRVVSSLVTGFERPVSRTRSPQNEGEQLAKGTSTEVYEILTHKIGLCLASFIPSSCSTFRLETITQTLTVWSIIQQNKYSLS